MAEIDKDMLRELKQIVGHEQEGEFRRKRVKIITDKKQFSVRIPIKFVEAIGGINSDKDEFEFSIVPISETKFQLKAILIKNE